MAIYYINEDKINIPTHKKPFGYGSEGKLYLIDDKLYKIYNPEAINEGFGNKYIYHSSLLGLNEQFKSFVLPQNLIFDENNNYVGYVTELIDRKKNREGVTGLDWEHFLSNIRNLEIEADMLSENRFLLVDLAFHNSIFNKEDSKLYMVDPGRYCHYKYFLINDYKRRNNLILTDYFKHMLKMDIHHFKLMHKNKMTPLVNAISNEIGTGRYSDYFEQYKDKCESVHEFLKIKSRFVK